MATCETCKQEAVLHAHPGMTAYLYCSDFCAGVTDEQKEAFRNAKEGEFCVYPCPGCGHIIEDEWTADETKSRCIDCAEKARKAQLLALLKESRDALAALRGPALGYLAQLVVRIDEALKASS